MFSIKLKLNINSAVSKSFTSKLQPPQNELAATAVAPAELIEALMAIPQNASGHFVGSSASQFGQRMSRGLSRRKSKARQVALRSYIEFLQIYLQIQGVPFAVGTNWVNLNLDAIQPNPGLRPDGRNPVFD